SDKLGLKTRAQLFRFAVDIGLLEGDSSPTPGARHFPYSRKYWVLSPIFPRAIRSYRFRFWGETARSLEVGGSGEAHPGVGDRRQSAGARRALRPIERAAGLQGGRRRRRG